METYKTNIVNHIMQETSFDPSIKSRFLVEREKSVVAENTAPSHFHDYYEIYYLVSGERYYFIKDKTYHIKSGTLVLINPYDIHYTTKCEDYGYERFLIHVNKKYFNDFINLVEDINLFECFEKDLRIIKFNFQEQHFIESLFMTMIKEYESKSAGSLSYMKTALVQLLIFINRHKEQIISDEESYLNSAHKTISQITGFINNNYYQNITLDEMSEKFYISPYHLSRTFKKITGFNFTDYINGVRIKEAQKLLVKTNMHIAGIAEKVGYKSNTHFGRVFKSITGMSPIVYREMQHNRF